jgi:hypothetical protein
MMVANRREIKQIIESIIKLAEGGEKWAIEAVADRVWPKTTGRLVNFQIPTLGSVSDVTAALNALMQACAIGAITPAECAQLSTVVSKTGEALAAKSIEERLARLEQAQPQTITSYRKVA